MVVYCLHQRQGFYLFFSSRRRHTRLFGDWSSDVCSSDLVITITLAVAVSLAGVASATLPMTVTVLARVPATVAATTIVALALPPTPRSPIPQVRALVPVQVPWLALAEPKVTPLGRGSKRV